MPLWELGEMDIVTPAAGGSAGAVACAVQLFSAVTVLSVREVAVTVMLSLVPPIAFDGMVTLSVAVPLPGDTVSGLGETLGDHPALSVTVRE